MMIKNRLNYNVKFFNQSVRIYWLCDNFSGSLTQLSKNFKFLESFTPILPPSVF
ncbi:MAG: hypothetical protein U5L45_21000 [Saprospiraceae bacterium]|nr:hypothetical protein [Saprospiraceae bacterium]